MDPLDPHAPHPPLTPQERADYEALYATAWTLAVEKAYRLLSDRGLAEDAAQSGYFKVWCRWSVIQPETRLGYLLASVRNAATDDLRHRKGHPGGVPLSIDAALSATVAHPALDGDQDLSLLGSLSDHGPEVDPERQVLAREALEELLARAGDGALRRLEVLLLAHGYNTRETAAILRRASKDHPDDPHVAHYTHATVSSIKMRRSRHRARLSRHAEREAERAHAEEHAHDADDSDD